jgi:dTDP-4-amino-4,6-dideoxygalactose transaminase
MYGTYDSLPQLTQREPGRVLDMAAQWVHSIGSTPKALVMVDVYGMRPNTDFLRIVCWRHDMTLIEDHLVRERRAPLERLPAVVARRREIRARYCRGLERTPGIRFMSVAESMACNAWRTCVVFEEFEMRDQVMTGTGEEAIECSLLWRPPGRRIGGWKQLLHRP